MTGSIDYSELGRGYSRIPVLGFKYGRYLGNVRGSPSGYTNLNSGGIVILLSIYPETPEERVFLDN